MPDSKHVPDDVTQMPLSPTNDIDKVVLYIQHNTLANVASDYD